MKRLVIIALCLSLVPIFAKAQVGPILSVEVEKEIVKNFSAAVEAEYRWQDAFKDTERISGSGPGPDLHPGSASAAGGTGAGRCRRRPDQ